MVILMKVIDERVIIDNINRIKKTNDIIMVLKDNAYGIGICKMINIAKKCNVDSFAVKNIEEGMFVRALYKTSKILILGKVKKKDIKQIIKLNLIPTINDYTDYLLFKENNIISHLEIDVGMNRFGIKNNYLAIINDSIIDEIYIHLYDNVIEDKINFIEQLGKTYNKKVHIGGSIAYGKTKSKLRIGRLLYENSIKFYGEIINIKRIKELETVGYEGLYNVTKESYIGICDVGYSDGLNVYSRSRVCISNKYYELVGRTCMDQCFVKIDDYVKLGDKVEFIGKNISLVDFAKDNDMLVYEVLLFLK